MTEPLSFTGERFTPEREGEIWYEHWHRYAIARPLCQHRAVLDVACGEGYGAAMLAESAVSVMGVDISADAVRHAKSRYAHQVNLEFITASCDCLPFPDASFDLAISFETIEHIETQSAFIAELARVLRPDGVLLISSPNKRLYSDAHDYHNEFHVRELYRDELEALLNTAFPYRSWLGQKLLFHSAIWPENQTVGATEYLLGDGDLVAACHCPSVEPMYYIVACSRNLSVLPAALNRISMFSDTSETVYQDYARQTRRVIELDRLLIDREHLIAERDDLLTLRTGQMEACQKLVAERDTLLKLRTGQKEESERLITERDALLRLRTEQMQESEQMIAERDALLMLRTTQMEEREQMIAERDKLLMLRTTQMEEREQMIAERDSILAQRTEQLAGQVNTIAGQEQMIAGQEQMIAALKQELDYRASLDWWLKSPWRMIKRTLKERH